MDIAVIGTGFIGGTLGRALAGGGRRVAFGFRHPDDDDVAGDSSASVLSVEGALAAADVVILALPGSAVAEFSATHREGLAGRLVIDATNQMAAPVSNGRAALRPDVRYARAFNTLVARTSRTPSSRTALPTCSSPPPRPTGRRSRP